MNKNESIIRASHSMEFACRHLQDMLQLASAVESIVVLQMVERAARLKMELDNFLSSVELDSKN